MIDGRACANACGWFFAALLVAGGIGIGLLLRGI
jgi:hypothetical protein